MLVRAVTKATKALEKEFPGAIIHAEKIPDSSRYRIFIVSEKFERMRSKRRYKIVLDVLEKTGTIDEYVKIGYILPFTPSELQSDSLIFKRKKARTKAHKTQKSLHAG